MYDNNKANSIGFKIGAKYDEQGHMELDQDLIAFISYNLNNHMIRIKDYTKEGFPETTRKLSLEEKEALYNLLYAVKEKLKQDFKTDTKVKRKSL